MNDTLPTGAKLVVLYRTPADPAAFDARYFEGHLPLVRRFPGLRCLTVSRGMGRDAPYYLMAEMQFDSADDLKACLRSPEAAAAVADVQEFAADIVTVLPLVTAEVWDPEQEAS